MIILANSLNKTYGNNVHAVKNVNISIEKGKFYLIEGRSGSGKTTLMHLLSLLDKPDNGEIIINNQNVFKLSDKEKAKIRLENFGFIFQSFHLNPKLKAFENVMLPMFINCKKKHSEIKHEALHILESLGLKNRYNHFPKELSGGEQQRVAIARSLANNPDCIFADEPTGNLDKDNEIVILDVLKKLTHQGKSVVVVSHNSLVEKYADQLFKMDDGFLEVN